MQQKVATAEELSIQQASNYFEIIYYAKNKRKKIRLFFVCFDIVYDPKSKKEGQRKRVIGRPTAIVSTFINEKTQKTLPMSTNENGNQRKNVLVSTNENAISQKTFFVSTRLDKYSLIPVAQKNAQKCGIII